MIKTTLKVLAVDDEQDNLSVLRTMLEQIFPGVSFSGAAGGKEALELALGEDPDVILLDIVMPGLDGFATCRRLKADPRLRHIPVVFLTAYKTDRESRILALEAGGDGFLAKPLEEAELTAQVRAMARIKAAAVSHKLEKDRLEVLISRRTRELEKEIAERRLGEARVRASLAEKEVLLKEIHHRVKNNLQVVSSLLNLQSRLVSDAAAQEAFRESRGRIRAMALVHEVLYKSREFSGIALRGYFEALLENIFNAHKSSGKVSFSSELCEGSVGVDAAVSLGLILNELVCNSFKHAFAGDRPGTIKISLKTEKAGYRLEVADDGPGLPPGYDLKSTDSLGMQLVSSLAKQLSGTVEAVPDKGARFVLRFPG